MGYKIEKYSLYKQSKNRYFIKAKVIHRNWFGSITSIHKEILDSNFKCTHERHRFRPFRGMCPIVSKEKAKWIVKTLNQIL